ncbi:MAG TPA: hypothetical protein VD995_04615 [Azospirillum sp.]|nr:hypothetical protein [Azospirillum sp.]
MTDAPRSVAIVAAGPSALSWLNACNAVGGRRLVADEVWTVNGMADLIQADRVFMMDGVEHSLAPSHPLSPGFATWLPRHPGPVYVPAPDERAPGAVAYPLHDVVRATGTAYFRSSVAYAIGLAMLLKVERLELYGCDFALADGRYEEGRANVEFLLGLAAARGMRLTLPHTTALLGTAGGRVLYGYGRPFDPTEMPADE